MIYYENKIYYVCSLTLAKNNNHVPVILVLWYIFWKNKTSRISSYLRVSNIFRIVLNKLNKTTKLKCFLVFIFTLLKYIINILEHNLKIYF